MPLNSQDLCKYHVVLVDFGKATKKDDSKQYNLSDAEIIEYLKKYPHIAPELTEVDIFKTLLRMNLYLCTFYTLQITFNGNWTSNKYTIFNMINV